jgi:curved DNA-binding protein CbpA
MHLNHYQILGVSPTASEEEIKSAFKTLAKKYHPDKNSGNPAAEEQFKKINSAYQILSDKIKRQRYDYILNYQIEKQKNINNTTSTHRQRTNNHSSERKNSNFVKSKKVEENKKNSKYLFIILSGFALFITAAIAFYFYMNKISALKCLEQGKKYAEVGQYVLAIESYSEAIDFNPSLSEAYIQRAEARMLLFKDTKGALLDFNQAIDNTSKSDYKLYFLRAKFYFKLKKYEEGLKDLEQAITINPTFDSLYFYKAEVNNYILQKPVLSILDYTKALSLNPKMKDALFGRAIAKQNSTDNLGSIQDFNRLISKYPEEGSYYYYRAYSKINTKDSSGACNDWEKAIYYYFHEGQEPYKKYCLKE